MKQYLIFILICLLIQSCKKEKEQETIESNICAKFIGKEIYIPDTLSYMNENIDVRWTDKSGKYILIHTLNFACDGCIYELTELTQYFDELSSMFNVKILIIAYSMYTPTINNNLRYYPYPILVDKKDRFKYINKIKQSEVLRSFLIKDGRVIFAGNLHNLKFQQEIINRVK